jgi:hypothetical protein
MSSSCRYLGIRPCGRAVAVARQAGVLMSIMPAVKIVVTLTREPRGARQ